MVEPRWPVVGAALLLSCAFSVIGCRSEAERAESREAELVSSAIQTLRAAPHNEKRPPLDRLRELECRHVRTCEAQQICAQAYSLHQKALDTSSLLRQKLREGSAPSVEAVGELLALAEKDLERSRRMMDECLRLETTMLVEARVR
jgi:hypothetical protein